MFEIIFKLQLAFLWPTVYLFHKNPPITYRVVMVPDNQLAKNNAFGKPVVA